MNLHQRIVSGELCAEITAVISSRADVPGVTRARDAGLTTSVIQRRAMSEKAFQTAVTVAVGDVDLVCMAGFLSLWRIPNRMTGRVINIHPALLPEFGGLGMYGRRVHEAVLAAGKTQSGCTVHFCDNDYDHGPIILQRKVPVHPNDTPDELAARVFAEECIAYPEAIRLFIEDRIRIQDGRVSVTT